MKKEGFSLFKSNNETIMTEALESIPELEIPHAFLTFLSMFQLGITGFSNAKRDFEGFSMSITNIEYSNSKLSQNLRLSHFYDVSELEERWIEDVTYSTLYHVHGLLPIAYNEANLDHVYIDVKGNGEIYYLDGNGRIELETSILKFCAKIFETEISDEDFKGKKVYRVWGDQYWQCE